MITNLRKRTSGFTIIEVMIVLAIAGLIILVVLLAVPALQRNSRNTAIKNDAAAIAGGISEFASNNDGLLPTARASNAAGSTVTFNRSPAVAPATAKIQGGTAVTFVSSAAVVTPVAGALTVDLGYKCPTVVTGQTVTPVVSTRATAVIYAIETSGALQARCLDT